MNKKFTKIAAFASAMVLTFSATSVAYAVEGENSTETTATTETKASVSGNPVVDYGDLTKDGAVDSKDAIKVLQFYAEKILDKDLTIDKFLSGDSEETTESTEAVTATTVNTEAITVATTAVTENTTDATEAATKTDGPKVQFNGAADASTESTDANTEASTSTSTETSTESTEASTDASTEATTEKTYSIGDVNGDGAVDTKDAILILQYYADSLVGNVETTVATESTEVATTAVTTVAKVTTTAKATTVAATTTAKATEAATTKISY